MTYIYFDESGDLGFDFSKDGTSRLFSITFLIVNNARPISKLVKKTFKSLPASTKFKNNGILHARYENANTVKKLLIGLSSKDIKIATIRLDKRKTLIASDPNELYANLVITLINRLFVDGVIKNDEQINLIASQRNTNKRLNECFSENVINSSHSTSITVNITKPSDDKCLQAADFVSWAFWQKYTREDNTYVELITDSDTYEYEMYS